MADPHIHRPFIIWHPIPIKFNLISALQVKLVVSAKVAVPVQDVGTAPALVNATKIKTTKAIERRMVIEQERLAIIKCGWLIIVAFVALLIP